MPRVLDKTRNIDVKTSVHYYEGRKERTKSHDFVWLHVSAGYIYIAMPHTRAYYLLDRMHKPKYPHGGRLVVFHDRVKALSIKSYTRIYYLKYASTSPQNTLWPRSY